MLTGQKYRKSLLAKTHLHQIRKGFEPKVAASIYQSSIQLRSKVKLDSIKQALRAGGSVEHKASLVMEHIGFDNFGKHLVASGLQHHLFDAYRKGAVMGAAQLKTVRHSRKAIHKFDRIAKLESDDDFNEYAFGSFDLYSLRMIPGKPDQLHLPFRIKPMPWDVKQIVRNTLLFKNLVSMAPTVYLPIKTLFGTQLSVYKKIMRNWKQMPAYVKGKFTGRGIYADYPLVVKKGDDYYIDDGHHRLTSAFLRGENEAKVKLIDLTNQIQKIRKEDFTASLDLTNPSTVDFLQTYLPELITGLNEKQKQAVLVAIQNGFNLGQPIDEIARNVRNVVGLTPNQAQYVVNFRNQLVNGEINGMTAPWDRRLSAAEQQMAYSEFYSDETNWDRVDGLVDRYQESLINRRAQDISRTEVHNASISGQQDIWDQATEQGLLDPNTTRRHWLGTDDGREREEHKEVPGMNPEGVGLDEPFDTPVGPVLYPGQSGEPSFDINCRCTVYLTFTDEGVTAGDYILSDNFDEANVEEFNPENQDNAEVLGEGI